MIAEHAAAAADRAEPLDLETVGIAIAALRLGDDPGIAERWHDAAPDGPGPWYWAAQLSAVTRPSARRVGSVGGVDPDELLTDEALNAAVAALARRNFHHYEAMSEAERTQAAATWRELATDVLVAVRSTTDSAVEGAPPIGAMGGRAVLVFEDVGEDDIAVHAAFHPELEEIGPDEVAGTPAQLVALQLLEQLQAEPE